MKTSEYRWYHPDFQEYNVAQEAVIPFCDEERNLVVCFGTAVGKTVIAECCFGYHLANNGKVAYVSPYRSLCLEKFDKWSNDIYLSTSKLAIQTGEKRSNPKRLLEAGLTVITTESFNNRTRVGRKWLTWLESLECIVFDEAHMIGDPSRGAAIESAIMRLTEVNPQCRLILLSATMDNAIEIAKWIKSLNDMPTKCFTSDWRPNEVQVVELPERGWNSMMDKVVERVKEDNGKTIVFVHSKRVGKNLVDKLKKVGIRTAFHNASMRQNKRDEIERAFNDKNSNLNVLISTSTLGAGVNIG